VAVHNAEHGVVHEVGNAYRLRSAEPTYTTPFDTAGEDKISPPVAAVHSGVQEALHEAGNAYSF
jgi:hypothetical protein